MNHPLKFNLQQQFFKNDLALKRFEIKDNQLVQAVKVNEQIEYSIDEILDRVEEGDVSILVKLGISYTEITDDNGNKKISFKYQNIRYTVNIIENTQVPGKTETPDDANEPVSAKDISEMSLAELENLAQEYEQQFKTLDEARRNFGKDSVGGNDEVNEKKWEELNKQIEAAMIKLDEVYQQIAKIELEEKYTNVQNALNELKNSPNADPAIIELLENQLEEIKSTDVNLIADEKLLKLQLQMLEEHPFEPPILIPPSRADFTTKVEYTVQHGAMTYTFDSNSVKPGEDGTYTVILKTATGETFEREGCRIEFDSDGKITSIQLPATWNGNGVILNYHTPIEVTAEAKVDEKAYQEAYNAYEKYAQYEYDRKQADLESNIATIKDELNRLEFNAYKNEKALLQLEKNIESIKNIQDMIDNAVNSGNKDLADKLTKILNELLENIDSRNNLQDQANHLFDDLDELNSSMSLSAADYTKVEYTVRQGNTVYTFDVDSIKPGENATHTITFKSATGENIERAGCKIEFDENGMITSIQVPIVWNENGVPTDYQKIPVTGETKVDEEAYQEAYNQYQKAWHEYDKKVEEKNLESFAIGAELRQLENQVGLITFRAVEATVEDKINQLESQGKSLEADALKLQLQKAQTQIKRLEQRRNFFERLLERVERNMPEPPNSDDYINQDGQVDEEAYNKGLQKYDSKVAQRERLMKQLNKQLSQVNESINEICSQLQELI